MWWVKERIGIEWRIALCCAGLLIGVAVALYIRIPVVVGGIGGAMSLGLFIYGRRFAAVFLLPSMMLFGMGYGSLTQVWERDAYSDVIGQEVELTGKVKKDPSVNTNGAMSLQLGPIQIRGSPVGGSVFTSVRTKMQIVRSDTVTVRGTAQVGFGNFPISLKNPTIVHVERQTTGDIGRVVRDWFAGKVRVVIDEPQASLGIGYLTGQKSALPEDLSEALKIAGLTHIVVASGYNLTVLVRLARRLLLPVSKFSAAMAALAMVLMFMTVTGLSPSMTRAGIVSGLSILFWYYGRKVHPIVLLLFVAALTVLYQPSYLWGDLGWQLSFSAFFGVMVIGPLLKAYFYGDRKINIATQTLLETLSAHIATVPIIALQFGVVSNVAIIANMLVVPLVPLAMLLTFIAGLWVIFGIGLPWLIAVPTSALLEYMVGVAHYVSELSWAQSELTAQPYIWGVYCFVVIAGCWWMWRASRLNLRTGDALNPITQQELARP